MELSFWRDYLESEQKWSTRIIKITLACKDPQVILGFLVTVMWYILRILEIRIIREGMERGEKDWDKRP